LQKCNIVISFIYICFAFPLYKQQKFFEMYETITRSKWYGPKHTLVNITKY